MVEGGEDHSEGVHHGFCVVRAYDRYVDGEEEEEVAQRKQEDGHKHVDSAVHS